MVIRNQNIVAVEVLLSSALPILIDVVHLRQQDAPVVMTAVLELHSVKCVNGVNYGHPVQIIPDFVVEFCLFAQETCVISGFHLKTRMPITYRGFSRISGGA